MNNNNIDFSVSFGESGTVYGCGHTLDTLLYSQKLYTEDDMYGNACDCAHENAIASLELPKVQTLVTDLLNDLDDEDAILRLLDHNIEVTHTELIASEMGIGDYLIIERPESLKKLMRGVKQYARNHYEDEPETCEAHLCPAKVFDLMRNAYDSSMESSHNEWLNGDRSHDGALERLTRAIFGNEEASITWDAKTDTVYVTASEEAIREMYGYDLDMGDPIPSPEAITEYLKAYVLHRCKTIAEEQRIARLSKQTALERQSLKASEERERLIEEAKQRKRQKTA